MPSTQNTHDRKVTGPRERIIKKLVAWAVAMLYHRVEVRQTHDLTAAGPQLANASHFGGSPTLFS